MTGKSGADRRHRRTILAAALTLAAALSGWRGANAAKAPSLTCSNVTYTPKRVPGAGGKLWIKLTASAGKQALTNVQVEASLAGGGGSAYSPLTNTKGEKYDGYVTVPMNPQLSPTTVTLTLWAMHGGIQGYRILGTVAITAGDGLPPPPPQ